MNATRTALLSSLVACLSGCIATNPKPTLVKLDSRPIGQVNLFARFQSAPGWQKLKPENGIFTFTAPDNYSSFSFRAQPVAVAEADCAKYAEETAKDVAYSLEKRARKGERDDPSRGTDTEVTTELVEHAADDASSVTFQLRIVDHKKIVPDRIVFGRTLCRPAALAVAFCTLTSYREESLTPACREMLTSVAIADQVGTDEAKLAYDADTLTIGTVRN